jgi:hypothetical protein
MPSTINGTSVILCCNYMLRNVVAPPVIANPTVYTHLSEVGNACERPPKSPILGDFDGYPFMVQIGLTRNG